MYEATLPFFSLYGKLVTGLQKIELKPSPLDTDCNFGVHQLQSRSQRSGTRNSSSDNLDDDDDPIWKASCILDQLQRFEESARSPSNKSERLNSFGQVPSVPWLDAMMKERASDILAQDPDEVSRDREMFTSCR